MRLSVPMEHGTTIIPSNFALPLAKGAFMLLSGMFCGLSGDLQFAEFLVDNLLGVGAEDQVQFVARSRRDSAGGVEDK